MKLARKLLWILSSNEIASTTKQKIKAIYKIHVAIRGELTFYCFFFTYFFHFICNYHRIGFLGLVIKKLV